MKKILSLQFVLLFFTISGNTQNNKITISYIDQFKSIAIKEMKRTGVPASITLSQAIVESNSGESNLAKNYQNHFGIKCKSDWKGAKAYQDDDAKNECFRAYDDAEQSFKDHSNFLKSRPNYVDLFLLDPVDDTAWAYGLKKAGYATATDYPKKLLKIIDDYELAQYNFPELTNEVEEAVDTIAKTVAVVTKSLNKPAGIAQASTADYTTPLPTKQLSKSIVDTTKNIRPTPIQTTTPELAKIDPSKNNQPTIEKQIEPAEPTYNYPEGRFRINQVPVLLGKKNRSFVEIALQHKLPLYKLFNYNDIKEATLLEKDQLIFLGPKKKEGDKSFHIVKYNTTLHEVSQLEGIQLSQLKLYNPKLSDDVKEGTQVLLFKTKETNPSIQKDPTLLFHKKNN